MAVVDPAVKRVYNQRYYQKQKKTRAHDVKDERKLNLQVRLPESLLGRLHRLVNEGVAMGKWPWKTMSECVKVLIVDGLRTRKGDDTIDDMLPHLEVQAQIDRIHQLRREAQSLLNKAREEIAQLQSIGASDQAVQYFHVTMDAAHKLPPTAWRDWLIGELRKAFPDLAKTKVKGVSLMGGRRQKVAVVNVKRFMRRTR